MSSRSYFRYWGKAKPQDGGAQFHLLPYHCLDVAAVGHCLLRLPAYGMSHLAESVESPREDLSALLCFFLALHDLGKFARGFQNLVPDMHPGLVSADLRYAYGNDIRHDTLGWLAWTAHVAGALKDSRLPKPGHGAWAQWFLAMAGHHGQPPREIFNNSPIRILKSTYFHDDDLTAAAQFSRDAALLLLPESLPDPSSQLKKALKAESWRLAGLAVLADWIGSNQEHFLYCTEAMPLDLYWQIHALPRAETSVAAAGLGEAPIRDFTSATDLFDYLEIPTPLQIWAAETPIAATSELFILEDVTGAGKTEAALILAHRLMAAGQGRGLYFGLPTMATSNQMYQRIGNVFRRFYEQGAQPNLVLAHGARNLVGDFEASILPARPNDLDYGVLEPSAGGACAAWLADSNKKALLAEVGVGTIDQSLMAIMPALHQSLRLLGLSGKVLISDEVHAFDAYTGRLLKILLEAHAGQGGSAILLSATLPNDLRSDLVAAFQRGLGVPVTATSDCTELEMPYPLATQAGETVSTTALATRPQVKRRVKVDFLHDVGAVFALIHAAVDAGQCVCWIRNSVDDAREAWSELQQADWLDRDKLMLFHSRFTLVDRLSIENAVIDTLGKKAQSAERRGRVLVSTQVIEQSLDLDADVMISDLAPVDLLIQRAGRLHRHLRDAAGNPATTDSRPAAVLHIFAPQFQAEPVANWYSSQFPRAAFVYPDTGRLWLTQKVLLKEGAILMPERARHLIEAVYGRYADAEIPSALLAATDSQIGKELSDRSLARSNALQLEQGYCRESGAWDAEERTPTRIGEEDREFVLLQATENGLQAWAADQRHRWAASTIKIAARKLDRIAPAWDQRFVKELAELRAAHRALRYVGLLPLVACGMNWQAEGLAARGRPVKVIYDRQTGLQTERGGG